MVLHRERLYALLDERLPGAVWLHGPTGAGKTMLLRSYLHRGGAPRLWLTADERHRDPAALFGAFSTAAASLCADPLPAFSPEHRGDPRAFATGYFGRLDQLLPAECAVVVDDAHHLDGSTAPLFATAIDACGGRRTLCFASQLMPEAAFAAQLAGSRLWTVGHRLLAFDEDEARALARRLGGEAPSLQALVDATDGWAAGLMLAMQLGGPSGTNGSDDPLESVRTPLALLIAGQVLGGVAKDDLARLRLLAELPEVPMDLADVAPDWASACARLQALSERGLFVERLVADRRQVSREAVSNVTRMPKGCWRLHDLLRNALRDPGTIGEPDLTMAGQLTTHLLTVDRLDLAWQLAARLETSLLRSVVASHGSAALRSPHLLSLLPLTARHADRTAPDIAFWMARALIGNENARALWCSGEAYEGYVTRGDDEGLAIAVMLAFFVIFATVENVGAMAVWVERFANIAPWDSSSIVDPEARGICVAGQIVHDLLINSPEDDGETKVSRQDCLTTIVLDEVLSANETMLAGSLLVAAMQRMLRYHQVESVIVRVDALHSYRQAAPHLRATWKIENGYHFAPIGSDEQAKRCFEIAIEIAATNTLLQPRIDAQVGLARLALTRVDLVSAESIIATLEDVGSERLGRRAGFVLHLRSRLEALRGDFVQALGKLTLAEELVSAAGFPQSSGIMFDQDRIQLLYATGAVREALALVTTVMQRTSESDSRRIALTRGLLEAHSLLAVERARAIALLHEYLGVAEVRRYHSILQLLPQVTAELAAEALREGICGQFVMQIVTRRHLLAPSNAPPSWPWAVRAEVLGPFKATIHGEPLVFAGKAQQKPLELLKYLACTRAMVAEATVIATALWPDADEASGKKNLEVTVARLRKLLGDDTLITVRDGKVALDARRVSSDASELTDATIEAESVSAGGHAKASVESIEHRLLALFKGLPLESEVATGWREAVRERYRVAFVRAARVLIGYWAHAGELARATSLIEAALVREPLAESLYRTLMQIHIDAGDAAEAMRVYRQCRQMLSVLIGRQPSVDTERLKDSINP